MSQSCGLVESSAGYAPIRTTSLCGLGLEIAEGYSFPFEEVHPDSDFFLIFFDDSLQKGKKLFLLPGIVLRLIYVAAELPHEFDVIHAAPSPRGILLSGVVPGGIQETLYRITIGSCCPCRK